MEGSREEGGKSGYLCPKPVHARELTCRWLCSSIVGAAPWATAFLHGASLGLGTAPFVHVPPRCSDAQSSSPPSGSLGGALILSGPPCGCGSLSPPDSLPPQPNLPAVALPPPQSNHLFTFLVTFFVALWQPCPLNLPACWRWHLTVSEGTPLEAQTLRSLACNTGDLSSIPGAGRSPGEGNGNPLQYSCLEKPMDGVWHLTSDSWPLKISLWDQGPGLTTESFCVAEILLQWERTENASDVNIRRETESVPPFARLKPCILFQLVTSNRKVLPDPLPYKITGLVRRFLLTKGNIYLF